MHYGVSVRLEFMCDCGIADWSSFGTRYGPGGYTCENLDSPQKGHIFRSNTCMCNATQSPYRLLGAQSQMTQPATYNNSFLSGTSIGVVSALDLLLTPRTGNR